MWYIKSGKCYGGKKRKKVSQGKRDGDHQGRAGWGVHCNFKCGGQSGFTQCKDVNGWKDVATQICGGRGLQAKGTASVEPGGRGLRCVGGTAGAVRRR